MRHVLHVYHPGGDLVARTIAERAPDRRVVALGTEEELARALPEITVLCAPLPPRAGWGTARSLRMIQLLGVGAEMLLPSPDLAASVEVATLRGLFAPEVTEHVFAMILALVRALPTLERRQRAREWVQFGSGTLAGRTLGIVGLGAIGRRIARAGAAFDMRVVALRRTQREPVPFVDREYAATELDGMLAESDVVVISLPKTDATTLLFDGARLAKMKPGALLVDVARGGIVDEAALVDALGTGQLGGAALDVFATEPLPVDDALWSAPNLIVTPHIAGWGLDYVARGAAVFLENVARLERGEPRVALVDREAGY